MEIHRASCRGGEDFWIITQKKGAASLQWSKWSKGIPKTRRPLRTTLGERATTRRPLIIQRLCDVNDDEQQKKRRREEQVSDLRRRSRGFTPAAALQQQLPVPLRTISCCPPPRCSSIEFDRMRCAIEMMGIAPRVPSPPKAHRAAQSFMH